MRGCYPGRRGVASVGNIEAVRYNISADRSDNAPALQGLLDSIGPSSQATTVVLPAGSLMFSRPLIFNRHRGLRFVGQGRAEWFRNTADKPSTRAKVVFSGGSMTTSMDGHGPLFTVRGSTEVVCRDCSFTTPRLFGLYGSPPYYQARLWCDGCSFDGLHGEDPSASGGTGGL